MPGQVLERVPTKPKNHLMLRRSNSGPKVNESLQIIEKCELKTKTMLSQAKMMQNLMMDLLDLGQIENNSFTVNKEFFSIFEAIE